MPSDLSLDGAVRLAHSGVIRASGPDADSFLHGQLTNDLIGLSPDTAQLTAYCSAKGRMLASFVAVRPAAETIWLVCRTDLLPATLKRLRMFVLRAQVRLDEGGDAAVPLGLAGPAAAAWLATAAPDAAQAPTWARRDVADGSLVRLPDAASQPRWLWIGSEAAAEAVLAALPALPLAHWDWLEVCSGIAPVVAATVEAFVPQMLNYELVGGVNFRKGCYPGQEIVARSQYRGTLKRRTALLHAEGPLAAGDEVYWSGDAAQPSGRVAFAAARPGGGSDALVELKLTALDAGELHAGGLDGPSLQRLELPYPLPRDAAD